MELDDHNAAEPSSHRVHDTLWVDKYRPKRFVELLGDEKVNLEVLSWVKEWDFCVFGKRKGKKRARESEVRTAPEDEFHRPPEKVRVFYQLKFSGLT